MQYSTQLLSLQNKLQGDTFDISPPVEQYCETVEKFRCDFQNPREILVQKTSFQQIIWKYANIFLTEPGGSDTDYRFFKKFQNCPNDTGDVPKHNISTLLSNFC